MKRPYCRATSSHVGTGCSSVSVMATTGAGREFPSAAFRIFRARDPQRAVAAVRGRSSSSELLGGALAPRLGLALGDEGVEVGLAHRDRVAGGSSGLQLFLLGVVHALLELLLGLPERTGQLRQLRPAEQDEDHHQ